MPFSPITVNTKTYNQAGDGRYNLSTVTFGQPNDYFQIKGGSVTKDRRNIVAVVSRVLEKDVTVNGLTERRQASVQVIITVPTVGFTSSELDARQSDIDAFLTSAILDRLLAGES
jgi:hypothetical protein